MTSSRFQKRIRAWYRTHGRHGLPWRKTRDPYRILVSEVMLQQTQVSRVLKKYPEFIAAFPNIRALDRAWLASVLRVWQGMGYNRRALYLKRLAHIVRGKFAGRIPENPDALRCLPGIGAATAGAVGAFAFGQSAAFIETNIRRVYLHHFFSGRMGVSDMMLLKKIAATLPRKNIREWYYALMDYGAEGLKRVPNANRKSAHYSRPPVFSGSRRELRGRVLAAVVGQGNMARRELQRRIQDRRLTAVLAAMQGEGLIVCSRNRVSLPG